MAHSELEFFQVVYSVGGAPTSLGAITNGGNLNVIDGGVLKGSGQFMGDARMGSAWDPLGCLVGIVHPDKTGYLAAAAGKKLDGFVNSGVRCARMRGDYF